MRHQLLFCLFCLGLSFLSAQAQHLIKSEGILIQFDAQNKAFIQYQVSKGQTLFSIRSKYGLSESEMMRYNSSLKSNQVNVNQWINIPIDHLLNFTQDKKEANDFIPIYYKIQSKENLYSIAKNKTKWNVKTIMSQNFLSTESIKTDQIIKIAYMVNLFTENIESKETDKKQTTSKVNIDSKLPEPKISEVNPIDENSIDLTKNEHGLKAFTNEIRGVALCPNTKLFSGKYYALCNQLKRGSMIEIYNPVLERSVLAKVVGKIPKNHTSDIQVIVSSEVANSLGAMGSKFFVYLRY